MSTVGTLDQVPGSLAAASVLPYTSYETLGQISAFPVDAESSVRQVDLGAQASAHLCIHTTLIARQQSVSTAWAYFSGGI